MDLLKFFRPQVLEEVDSRYNGRIKVTQEEFGTKYISTGFWTQSGGLIKDLWQPSLKKIKPRLQADWLILGLAAGTSAKIIAQKYQPQKIVGVEIDPVMVSLGKKYFSLDQIPQLEIILSDAQIYLPHTKLKFNYILVDMYMGDRLPQFVYSSKFVHWLKKCLLPGGSIIFNHLFYTASQKTAAEKFVHQLEADFSSVTLLRRLTNLLIICK